MLKSSGMTVTPLRTTAMTSPTVPPQPKANNRISNFSVASLLADTRPKSPASLENTADLLISATNLSRSPDRRHAHSPLSTATSPAHLAALSHQHQQYLQHQQQQAQAQLTGDLKGHNLVNNHLTKVADRLAHPARTISHNSSDNPSGEIESDIDYDSNQEDEEEDSMVDIEDCNEDNDSRSSQSPKHMRSSQSQGHSPAGGGPVPIRPTPFSALAAAAVAWGGVPWPGARQMPPFGPPGLFPGQGFGPGGMSGRNSIRLLLANWCRVSLLLSAYFIRLSPCNLYLFIVSFLCEEF